MAIPDTVRLTREFVPETLLRGWSLDRPASGAGVGNGPIEFAGWVVGTGARIVAVEVRLAESLLARSAVDLERPDVARAVPDVPMAVRCGFVGKVPPIHRRYAELRFDAVREDRVRIPMAKLELDRPSRESTSEWPLVSVVIPCYRQARFLGEAIESVLAQSYPHIEIVVVDDGSPDNSGEVARRYPDVVVVRQANAGLAAARNTGFRASRGEYLAFLDADDRLLPDGVAAGMEALRLRPECAFAFGRYQFIVEDGRDYAPPARFLCSDTYASLLIGNYIAMHATCLFRRSAIERVGGYDPEMRACEDYDLYLRIAKGQPFCRHEGLVAEYRQHGDNMTRDAGLMLRFAITVLMRQRHAARTSESTALAFNQGMATWRQFYAEPLIDQFQAAWQTGDWSVAIGQAGTLLRYAPWNFLQFLAGRFVARLPSRSRLTQSLVSCVARRTNF